MFTVSSVPFKYDTSFPINLSWFHDVDTSRSTGASGEKSSVSCAIECAEMNVRRDKHEVLFKPLLR